MAGILVSKHHHFFPIATVSPPPPVQFVSLSLLDQKAAESHPTEQDVDIYSNGFASLELFWKNLFDATATGLSALFSTFVVGLVKALSVDTGSGSIFTL